jgi:hypothetical protein
MRYTFIPDPERAERKRVRLKPRGNVESFAVPTDEALRPPPAVVPIATLERYIGAYEIRPNAIVTVRRDVDSLTAEVAGRPVVTLMPESPTLFRVKQGPATIEFKTDDSGAVNGLVMVQNGRVTPAKRVP